MWRQRLDYFYSYRAARDLMLGGLWQRGVLPSARRRVVSDEKARTLYLGVGSGNLGALGPALGGDIRLTATA